MLQRPGLPRHGDRPACNVCGDALRFPHSRSQDDPAFPTCSSAECQYVASQRSRLAPPVFAFRLEFQGRLIRERRAREAAENKQVAETTAREALEHQHILHLASLRKPDSPDRPVRLVSIPSGHTTTTRLPGQRLASYRAHLEDLIGRAAQCTNEMEALSADTQAAREKRIDTERLLHANPALRTLSDKLCGMCKGGCCTAGADTAYLTVATLRRFMDANPDLSAGDVLDAYLSRIGLETVEGACINQTSTGCGLPREMRSDTCNGYYCASLLGFHAECRDDADIGTLLAIRRAHSNWRRFDSTSGNDIVEVAWVGTEVFLPVDILPVARDEGGTLAHEK